MHSMSTFVLVHGAWGGAHGWRWVRPLLQQAGHQVSTPSLTGLGERSHLSNPGVNLSTHVQDVVNHLFYEDLSDVVLVGHSYGGMVVSGAADRVPERIAHLVFLDAFQPSSGQSLVDLTGGQGQQPDQPGGWQVPPMRRTLDPSDPLVQWSAARRGPQSRACFDEKVVLSMPLEDRPFSLTYIVATQRPDPSPYFDQTAERLRQNPRWTVRPIEGDHNMQMGNPSGLAELLLELCGSKVPAATLSS
jgi:pimeloyl-ACP methyl ester carboxylesterase